MLLLDHRDFFGLHAFLTFRRNERNLLAFFQALETVGLDRFEVDEKIVSGLGGDEAKTFLVIEPFHGSRLAVRHLGLRDRCQN